MNELAVSTDRPRDHVFELLTRVLAVVLLPIAFLHEPGRARFFACQWALGLRFPAENLSGLDRAARIAFTEARAEAFWRDGQLIGLTSGHRDAAEQHRMFADEVRRTGSVDAARTHVLPAEESTHVRGIAMDVRPTEGARWLEVHGDRHDLYRRYDNEWWHFEFRPDCEGEAPERLPHPGVRRPVGVPDW
ncbi:D,D-peptidase/D,D-carboxypeptidase VanY-N [Amycolatopsis sp.]|jgi:D-alanyl-D-alanine carboxypeptidase|uniref:D,D-peptidase/D,D-carboxypeptidase VanY-N n=1 Tax=Amycolatopsis sp. TaxID=37632 RepID=UPI00263318FB|nr:D,D-peptidase/D,D-carboxypeptidase VanY-N [Amycolatopsis sp.]